jgi:hypothetical protein
MEYVSDHCILTATGKRFNPFEPTPEMICLEDIAYGLSNICRFAGQIRQFYTVAQHSFHVARSLPIHLKIHGYLHDAAEAYIGDVPRPYKRHPFYSFFAEIERKILEVIYAYFEVKMPTPEEEKEVKRVDDILLRTEFALFKEGQEIHLPPDKRVWYTSGHQPELIPGRITLSSEQAFEWYKMLTTFALGAYHSK